MIRWWRARRRVHAMVLVDLRHKLTVARIETTALRDELRKAYADLAVARDAVTQARREREDARRAPDRPPAIRHHDTPRPRHPTGSRARPVVVVRPAVDNTLRAIDEATGGQP